MRISEKKRPIRQQLEDRIRAHLRAAMVENGLGLNETGRLLIEDPGTITRTLQEVKPRGPTAYLAMRMSQVFSLTLMELFNKDPPQEFFKPGTPVVAGARVGKKRHYPITSPSTAFRTAGSGRRDPARAARPAARDAAAGGREGQAASDRA